MEALREKDRKFAVEVSKWFDGMIPETMSIKAKATGTRNEYKSIKLLVGLGYEVFRMAGSLGIFDLIAVSKTEFLLIQVKTNRMPSKAETALIRNFECPTNARKFIHVWKDRLASPIVQEVS